MKRFCILVYIIKIALVIGLVSIVFVSTVNAAPISMKLHLSNPTGPLLVDGTPQLLTNGMTFIINVDDTTADTWAPTDFGLFPVNSVTISIPDLSIFNELVTTPLAYFEDDYAHERAGLSPLFPDAGVQTGFSVAGQTQIGDPNVIDTIPNIIGVQEISLWSKLFSIQVQGGPTISVYPPGGRVFFGTSSLSVHDPCSGQIEAAYDEGYDTGYATGYEYGLMVEEITICHHPEKANETKTIRRSALMEHLGHGDYIGECE
jgi:hypothetical protein